MRIELMGKWLHRHWFEMAILLVSSGFRFLIFDKTNFSPGWDSYFYIVQIKSFIEEGSMHSSRLSLFYPFLLSLQYLVSDYELAYKLSAALLTGIFSLQIFYTARSLNPNFGMAHLAAGYTMVSPQLTYFAAQYSKNLLGAVCLLWLLRALDGNGQLKKGLIVVVNLFAHKLTAGLSFVLILLQLIAKRLHKKYLIFIGTGLAILLGLMWALPALFSLKDFHRTGMGLTTVFAWPSLTLINSFEGLINSAWLIDIIICNLLFGLALILLLGRYLSLKPWLPFLMVLSGLTFPFLEWSLVGISFRALMLFLILCPLLISLLNVKINLQSLLGFYILFLVWGTFSYTSYDYKKHDPPYVLYDLIVHKIDKLKHHEFELIIAHKALAEFITFKNGIDVLPWEPEYEVDQQKLWRICTGINQRSIEYYGKEFYQKDLFHKLTPNYNLIREDLWDKVMVNLEQEDPDYFHSLLTWKNPHRIRPDYLLNNKKSTTPN